MFKVDKRRIFGLDLDYGLGEESADFYEDGTMLPADRERILAASTAKVLEMEPESKFNDEDLLDISNIPYLEVLALEKIAAILKAEADYRPPTEEERKAAWIAQQQKEAEKYYRRNKDLQAWDNDSDEPSRPSIHWRELDLYDD